MRKNIVKTFVIVNTIALGLLGSLAGNSASARTGYYGNHEFYANGHEIPVAGKDSFYINGNMDTIDIKLDSGYYNIYIDGLDPITRASGWVRGINVKDIRKDGVYQIEIQEVGKDKNSDILSFVVDRTEPDVRIDKFSNDYESDEYTGSGSIWFDFTIDESRSTMSDVDKLLVAYEYGNQWITLDTLDPSDDRFKLSSSDIRQIGDSRPEIHLLAVDKAGNINDLGDSRVRTDYDTKKDNSTVTDYSYLLPELMEEAVKVNVTVGGQQLTFLPNSMQYEVSNTINPDAITIDFYHASGVDYYLGSKADGNKITGSLSGEALTAAKTALKNGSITIYYESTKDATENGTTTIRFKTKEAETKVNGSFMTPTISSDKLGYKETKLSSSAKTISKTYQDTISIDNDVAYYSTTTSGTSYSAVSSKGFNEVLRGLAASTYNINIITHSGDKIEGQLDGLKIEAATDKKFTKAPVITIGKDKNPLAGFTVPIEINFAGVTNDLAENGTDYYEIVVNGKTVDFIKDGDTNKIKNNIYQTDFRTTGTEEVKIEVEVVPYNLSTGNAVTMGLPASTSAKVEELDKVYATIDYAYSTKDAITVSVTVFDPNENLRDCFLVLYKGNDEYDRVRISSGTTVHTFKDLTSASSYSVQVEGEGRKIDTEKNEDYAVLNGERYLMGKDSIAEIPYTDDLKFTTLGNSDVVQIYDYKFKYDPTAVNSGKPNGELELSFYYEVLDDNTTKSLDVDIWYYDKTDGNYHRFGSGDYDGKRGDEISLKSAPGKYSATVTLQPEKVEEAISSDTFYRVVVSDGRTNVFMANFYPENTKPDFNIETKFLGETNAEFYITQEENDTEIDRATLYVYETRDDYTDSIYKADVTKDKSTVRVSGLDKDTDYTVEVRVDYTTASKERITNDLIARKNFTTGKTNPEVRITNVISSGSNIYFDYVIRDDADFIIDARAQLYSNGKRVDGQMISLYANEEVSRESFENIEDDKEYEIRVELEYKNNVNDEITKTDNYVNPDGTSTSVKVYASKMVPVANATTTVDFNKITVDVELLDENNSLQYNPRPTIKIFKDGVGAPIASAEVKKGENKITFDKLTEDTKYTVKVDVYYKPSPSSKSQMVTIYQADLKTLKEVDAKFDGVKTSSDSITMNIFVTNNKKFDIFAEIKQGDNVLGKKELALGNNKISFTGIEPSKSYEVVTYAIDDKGEKIILNSDMFKSIPETIVTKPTFEIVSVNPDGKTLNIVVNVSDPDNVIKPQVVTVTIKDPSGQEVVNKHALREIKDHDGILSITLPFEENSIKVSVNYENADQETVEIYQTIEYSVAEASDSNIVAYVAIGVLSVAVIAMGGVLIYRRRH